MFKNLHTKPITALFLFILIFACSKDKDPVPANEEEIITLVTLEVSKVGSSEIMSREGYFAPVDYLRNKPLRFFDLERASLALMAI